MAVVRAFEEKAKAKAKADELDYYSLVKGAAIYAEQMDLRLQLEWPNPTCIQQEDETSREAGGGPEPEASGTEVTERGAKTELAWQTYLSQERRTGY